jgi:hypothetical protein
MTAMAYAFTRDEELTEDELIQSRFLKRSLLPEDVGHAVVFLASPHAINGDGGALPS